MNINSTIVLAFAYSILGSEFSNSHITTPDTLEMFFYRTDAVPKCSKFVGSGSVGKNAWESLNASVSASFSVTFSLRKISSESSCGVKMAKGMEIERMNTEYKLPISSAKLRTGRTADRAIQMIIFRCCKVCISQVLQWWQLWK